ncbi:Chaperone protein dnaJ [Malassezia psittaci]|uniref:Chaperone protein dnaJ n=1 Tax=Malassezia psittaci TaxID=1821823 RepID=A0AAF0FB35_9BASI|nr:Chaperone protein dnaJ [Malassezia psittaci]
MEMDDALKALGLARKHDASGNKDAALKWARKSVAIYRTEEAVTLVSRLETVGTQGSSLKDQPSTSTPMKETYTSQKTETISSSSDNTKAEYTQTQIEIVRRVKRAGGDFYSVLQIEKTASDAEIKKSYKKLALQLHPDKNRAPGADEAFKLVSKAFTVLSDKDKRAAYDRFGGDPDSRFGASSATASGHPFSGFGDGARMRPGMGAEIDPEDLFNMFFGGGMGRGGAAHARRAPGQRQGQNNQNSFWFQVLPILVLLAFSLLSYLPSLFTVQDPDFRWRPTTMHRAHRTTFQRGVSYYVDPVSFARHPYVTTASSSRRGGSLQRKENSSPELLAFERRVEESWMKELYRQCEHAQDYKRRRLADAQGFFGFGRLFHIRV